MRDRDWFMFIIFVAMMLAVGFTVFERVAVSIIFGLAVGGLIGWLFSGKKKE